MHACGHPPIWSGQRTLRTSARGRHTYLPEFKYWLVEQALQPGMSLAALAMGNQVNPNQLRRWVQLHGKHGDADACRACATVFTAPPPRCSARRSSTKGNLYPRSWGVVAHK